VEFFEDDVGQHAAQLLETSGAGEFGDCFTEFATRCCVECLRKELLFELSNVDGHRSCSSA